MSRCSLWSRSTVWLAGVVLLVAGCGGGGGGGGPDLASGGTSGSGTVGGTSGSGVAGGGVTGFGSVIVNGVTYRTSADDAGITTTFVGPNSGFGEADLAPGMLVQVDWERDSDSAPREAVRITYLPELIGTVTGALVPAAGGQPASIEVAGRTVTLTPSTVIDDPFGRASAGVTVITDAVQLVAGTDRVEISGFVLVSESTAGASHVRASRIARIGQVGSDDPLEIVSGTVSDSADGSFVIRDVSGGIVSVAFDPAVVSDAALFESAGASRLRDGAAVRVTGQLAGSAMTGVTGIRRVLDDLQPVSTAATLPAEIQGPVTAPPNAGSELRVDGQRVRFDGTTVFAGGTAADLLTGRLVRAEGELQASDGSGRVLLAERIAIEPEPDVSLEDLVTQAPTAADASGNRSFVTRIGVTVRVRPDTVLKDDSDLSPDGRLNLNDLDVGDFVEVDGFFDSAGRLVAVKVERDDEDDGCELEARVRGSEVVGASRFYTIAGRPGLVVADVGDDPTLEKVAADTFGEFEAEDVGNCGVRPDGVDIDGEPIDAGFLADDVEQEDGPDGGDDDDD